MPVPITRMSDWQTLTVTIATDDDLTNYYDGRAGAAYGLVIPSTFDGTTITFTVSHDNSTYQALYDETGAQVSMTVAASRSYRLPDALFPWQFWKIATGTAQTTTNTVFVVCGKG